MAAPMKPAAIMASLVDVRNVAAHKSVRLEVHVPAEQAGAVLAAFGWPTMSDPVPVAIARLGTDTAASGASGAQETPPARDNTERRAWNELPAVQQAGIRCNEKAFWRFLGDTASVGKIIVSSAEGAARVLRDRCGVTSRSEFRPNTPAEKRWQFIDSAYEAWLKAPSND